MAQTQVFYVDDDASGGDGLTWETALPRLTDALALANTGDEIRIAGGVYRPDESSDVPNGTGDRTESFVFSTWLTVKGGFAGLALPANPNMRDLVAHESILSGDLDQNDTSAFGNRTDNSHHVVRITGNVVLDGLVVSGGQTDASDRVSNPDGAGVIIEEAGPTLRDCTIRDNRTADGLLWPEVLAVDGGDGAGLYASAASATLIRCKIHGNRTGNGAVGMCQVGVPHSPTAGGSGAGVCVAGGSLLLENCQVYDNQTGGGAAGNSCDESPIGGSHAGSGAGLHFSNAVTLVRNCLIYGNTTGNGGPGGSSGPYGAPGGNGGDGAGIFMHTGTLIVESSTIADNATGTGGAAGDPNAPNGNAGRGGAIAATGEGFKGVTNSILWGNSGGQVQGGVTLTHCCVQGGFGGTNIDADPEFVPEPANDYHLTLASPCINAGDPNFVPIAEITDIDGEPRRSNGRIDIGADELLYDDCNDNGTSDSMDLSSGESDDCNDNGAPDECDLYMAHWETQVVDDLGDVGMHASLAMLPSGYPAIAYYDVDSDLVKYAWSDGTHWQIETIFEGLAVETPRADGAEISLAILPTAMPAIAYHRAGSDFLQYVWREGESWQHSTIASVGAGGGANSLAILPSGDPAVCYHDASDNQSIKYAWFEGNTWRSVTLYEGDSVDYPLGDNSIAVLPNGLPAVTYRLYHSLLASTNELIYAAYDGTAWNQEVVEGAPELGIGCSLEILSSGYPAVSYYKPSLGLRFAAFDGTQWQIETVTTQITGVVTSLEILPNGKPGIAYSGTSNDLRYAERSVYGGWDLISLAYGGEYPSLAVMGTGHPAVAHYDSAAGRTLFTDRTRALGGSYDCQEDGIPDECQLGGDGTVYQHDDGTYELTKGGEYGDGQFGWLNHFWASPDTDPLSTIEIVWGDLPADAPATVYVWNDPAMYGFPENAEPVASVAVTARSGQYDTIDIPLTEITESFFVGVIMDITATDFPAAMDDSLAGGYGDSWAVYDPQWVDPANLGTASMSPFSVSDLGVWMLRARVLGPGENDVNENGIPDDCEGACCYDDGSCMLTDEYDCGASDGTWNGFGTTCDPNPCPQPYGACCILGTCTDATEADCAMAGGVWQGAFTECDPNTCPPAGACCLPDHSCQVLIEADCQSAAGTWLGAGTTCDPNPCQVLGDHCDSPFVISELPFSASGNTCGFLDDYDESCFDPNDGDGGAPDVVYQFTPTEDVFVDISLCDSSFDTTLSVYIDDCDYGQRVYCSDDACGPLGLQSSLTWAALPAGYTYYIVVDGKGDCGDYTLNIAQNGFDWLLFCQWPEPGAVESEAEISEAGATALNRAVFDNFNGVDQSVCGLIWWGFMVHDTGEGLQDCNDTPVFNIAFHEDADGQPGAVACSYVMEAMATSTDIYYGNLKLHAFIVPRFESCCSLAEGWLSIQGAGDPDCMFMWLGADGVDDRAWYRDDESDTDLGFDLGFCLLGDLYGDVGACCFDGACLELTETDCMLLGGIWQGIDTSCDPNPCAPQITDCNNNGVEDAVDILEETSADVNGNGIPDECEIDCNGNGVPDSWEISTGASADVNGNGVPDVCETDCNGNSVPDSWDISTGAAADCNRNGIPDSCDLTAGRSADADNSGVPDECEADCNGNGLPDALDLAGDSEDCNGNGVPDECEVDSEGDGVIDDCDNCPLAVNADQADSDGDGAGDACDPVDPGESPEQEMPEIPTDPSVIQALIDLIAGTDSGDDPNMQLFVQALTAILDVIEQAEAARGAPSVPDPNDGSPGSVADVSSIVPETLDKDSLTAEEAEEQGEMPAMLCPVTGFMMISLSLVGVLSRRRGR